jgi:hypothetical protein
MTELTRNINVQIRLNEKEYKMLDMLSAAYGLKKNDVIRKLIRDDWDTFQPPEE